MALSGRRTPLPDLPVVHHRFAEHVRKHPDRIALTSGDETRTYAELDARANRVAHYLIALGIGRGSVVGICIDRSTYLMESILGVLKAGAAYLPLDPAYPPDRLRLMVSQVDSLTLILAAPSTFDLVESVGGKTLDLAALEPELQRAPQDHPQVAVGGDDLCYVVFTSGSTGIPKATAVRHKGWFNLMNWLELEYGLDETSSNLMISSFGFDISQRSLMTALFTGATQHLLPSRSFDVTMAYRIIRDRGVRTLHCAPSTLYLLVDREVATGGEALTHLDYVFIGGEPLSARRVADWATRAGNRCLLLHQYGVAECTDVATSHRMVDFPAYRSGPVPVGPPVYNMDIHLLDEELAEVPAGEVGEICISGISVGAGYLNAGPLDDRFTTAEIDGAPVRIYRTGDRGFQTPDGELVVVGRLDAQVKVRGMRIDLGDVEHAVRQRDGVDDVVVVAVRSAGDDLDLVAFVILSDPDRDVGALRRELLSTLPRNMVPQELRPVPAFPLSPNGKVDRKALRALADPRQPAPAA